ncbi:MAG: 4-hydroxythreonine-4-phosphate dehydrogenase PdxA [Oceanospirillaceae bacterium]|nr:4-hydroxythreonine-4-phosphate dehydrogenase PdxA [Oceanospirillaceae bacterium]
MIKRIAITSGEPAGIGPELIVKISQHHYSDQLIAIGDPELFKSTAATLNLPLDIILYDQSVNQASRAGQLYVKPIKLNRSAQPGQLDTRNASYVIATLQHACNGCLQGNYAAMVTPPVHKGIINEAGIPFSGHTEFLQQQTQASEVVMMLATEELRVALVTTHLPLQDVSRAITRQKLRNILNILLTDLRSVFGIPQPKILICGLNPHAGEDGHMGREEIDIINPVLEEFTKQGIDLIGPLPADTLFTDKYLRDCDAVLAMYHDQGLPVLKYSGFGKAVNITLGLPIIRTSVDHGTAINIAGQGTADTGSLAIAIQYASKLAHQRQRNTKGQD